MENQPLPAFVYFNNATNTISYRPDNNTDYQGNTYYFSIVLKNTHSDYIMNTYYITVKFTGDVYVAPTPDDSDNSTDFGNYTNDTFVPTKITFNITAIDWKSNGQMVFSQAVNMTNIAANFLTYFDVYVNSKTRNLTEEIIGWEITSTADDTTLNFTVEFLYPYLYGLLNKKKDYLVIALVNGTDPSLLIYNTTADVFGNNNTQFSIPM
jgi:hypothetical protein